MEEIPAKEIPHPVTRWVLMVRAYAFPATVIPVLVSLCAAINQGEKISGTGFILMLLSGLCLHAGTNLINDYYDFQKGIDRAGEGCSSWALTQGLISGRGAFVLAIIHYSAGVILGLPLILTRGWPLLVLGVAGIMGGYFYTAPPVSYKYRGWGEPCVFFLMGPLLCVAAFLAITGKLAGEIILYALPPGFLVTLILYGNNLRDIKRDHARGIKTLAIGLGYERARWGYPLLVTGAYGSVLSLFLQQLVTVRIFLTLLALPLFIMLSRNVLERDREKMKDIDIKTANLYLLFGVLYLSGIPSF